MVNYLVKVFLSQFALTNLFIELQLSLDILRRIRDADLDATRDAACDDALDAAVAAAAGSSCGEAVPVPLLQLPHGVGEQLGHGLQRGRHLVHRFCTRGMSARCTEIEASVRITLR